MTLNAKYSRGLLVLSVGMLLCAGSVAEEPVSTPEIRRPARAGSFYPSDKAALRKEVDSLLNDAPTPVVAGRVVAVAAPHAGYIFSGRIAARVHRYLAQANFDTLVIIGHDTHMAGVVALISPADVWRTPLGDVPVDVEMVRALVAYSPGIRTDRRIHASEHTVEVHLPFLQAAGKTCKIVPVLFGSPSAANCRAFAKALEATSAGRRVMVLASTDMSHYPPYEAARKLDATTIKAIKTMDVDAFFGYLQKVERSGNVQGLRTAMCASGGVGTAMLMAKAAGADRVEVLQYANSGDVPVGSPDRVVGYVGALFVKDTAVKKSE